MNGSKGWIRDLENTRTADDRFWLVNRRAKVNGVSLRALLCLQQRKYTFLGVDLL